MKKFTICLIAIVIIVFLVAILKGINTTNYSHSDIVALINKGTQSMDNVSFDKENSNGSAKFYFKGDKCKMISLNTNNVAIVLDNGKTYTIDSDGKNMFITTEKILSGRRGLQDEALRLEHFNENNKYKDKFRYELSYIRDETIDNKDCIFVKECTFEIEDKKYLDYCDAKKDVHVYWIEKSTGFVIGGALMKFGENKATPQTIIKNIKCGEVTDDIFNDMFTLPNDYNVFETTKDNKVEKIK